MKNCIEIRNLMSLFIDGELEQNKIDEFNEHIGKCKDCKTELNETMMLLEACKDITEEELPFNFKEELHSKLLLEKKKQEEKNKVIMMRKKYYAICSSIAAILLIAFIIKGYDWNKNSSPKSETSANEIALGNSKPLNGTTVAPTHSESEKALNEDKKESPYSAFSEPKSSSAGEVQKQGSSGNTSNSQSYSIDQNKQDVIKSKNNTEVTVPTTSSLTTSVQFNKAVNNVNELKSINVTVSVISPEEAIEAIKTLLPVYESEVIGLDGVQNYEENGTVKAFSANQSKTEYLLNIKIPNSKYDEFIAYLKSNFKDSDLEFSKMNVTDVTNEIKKYEEKISNLTSKNNSPDINSIDLSLNQKEIIKDQAELDKLKSDTSYSIVVITFK